MKDQLLRDVFATSFMPRALAIALCAAPLASAIARDDARGAGLLKYEVVATHPHDARAFTQGLAVMDGRLLESRGLYGESALALEDVASGAISGVLGAYLLLFPRAHVLVLVPLGFFSQLVRLPAMLVLGLWFAMQLLSEWLSGAGASGAGVAFRAHIGGFVAGLLLLPLFLLHKRLTR